MFAEPQSLALRDQVLDQVKLSYRALDDFLAAVSHARLNLLRIPPYR